MIYHTYMYEGACSKKLFSILQDVLHLQSSWITPTKFIDASAKPLDHLESNLHVHVRTRYKN